MKAGQLAVRIYQTFSCRGDSGISVGGFVDKNVFLCNVFVKSDL
jgi:hypothetical protein